MVRGSFKRGELLLGVLWALERRPLAEGEIVGELDAFLGERYRVRLGGVLAALEALAAEGLVDVATRAGSSVYRITREGIETLERRADAPVLAVAGAGVGSDRVPEPLGNHVPERVAVLFTDVVGSTELLDRLGDEAANQLRRRHFALLRSTIGDHEGREVKSLGDGLMVVFGSARAAVACALAMQRAVAACQDPLVLRIGIAAGEVLREDDDYFGRPVIVARRLCDAGRGGEVLVSDPTPAQAAGRGGQRLEPVRPLVLKGLSEPVAVRAMRVPPLALSA